MKLLIAFCLLLPLAALGQKVSLDPSVTPGLFTHNTQITVTYDVTGTSLQNLSNAYIWVWLPGLNTDAKYNINPASSNVTATNNAKFTKSVTGGKTLFSITFIPSDFFDGDISTAQTIGMLLKGNDWPDGQTTDYLVQFWDGGFQINLIAPRQRPLFVNTGDEIEIAAETPAVADFELYINEVLVASSTGTETFNYVHTVTETGGGATVRISATDGTNTAEEMFQYVISAASPQLARPAGIIQGINYSSDETRVTLCLRAPGKTSAYVTGDFTGWEVSPEYMMYRDGEYFWITVANLVPMQEYAFQYIVDESIFIADPFADKILDPDDQYIPEAIYPGLMPFPEKARRDEWYFNRVAVFQTGQDAPVFSAFVKPPKEKLVIYELLIRDFFANGERSYKNLIDTIGYFRRLGVNAIELMPIMEFNGNEGWGYNPTFMFAPDKYYGTKEDLRDFVNACHENGIAVILDIALNHQDVPNPFALLDFNFGTFMPEPDNKWFNVTATHPFSVFFDMNHESPYTQQYVDTVAWYWLKKFNVDGFRFDLSKGFTQRNNPSNVDAWSQYDASRIALIKRMADRIWEHTPDAYIILEHLAVNSEEKELAEYRADEGKGMMLWGKMTDPYNQLTMGYEENSDISGVYHAERGWAFPHLVGYMESHDEERLMVKNVLHGNIRGDYNVRDTATAIFRERAAAAVFYTLPGPKMLWQFGELGFDYSINYCEDGSISNDCRLSPKPVPWDYKDDRDRAYLLSTTSDLIRLHTTYDVFSGGVAEFQGDNGLVKKIVLRNQPYTDSPASAEEMNVALAANLDLSEQDVTITFPHSGTWYDYYNGGRAITVNTTYTVPLLPGDFRIYTDFPIEPSPITGVDEMGLDNVTIYPVPVVSTFRISVPTRIAATRVTDIHGRPVEVVRVAEDTWDASSLSAGVYIVNIHTAGRMMTRKIIKF